MDLRPALQIQTVIKTLTDVIVPALDPNNGLAQEQARLSIGTLQLVLQRQASLYRYDLDELKRSLELAGNLRAQAQGLPGSARLVEALEESAKAGADVRERARAEPGELEAANLRLREDIGALVTAVHAASELGSLKQINSTVMAHAREQLLRERSWLIAQGWEPDPKSIPAFETLIGAENLATAPARDKSRPSPEWIAELRRGFPCEKEIDRILTRKMQRRSGPGYSSVSLDTLTQGVHALLTATLAEPFRIEKPRWLSGGASKVQMAFDLLWNRPGVGADTTTMVLRMEPAESIVETSRLREFQLIKAFDGVIPVPAVFWVDGDAQFLPYPAMICGFAPGVPRPTVGVDGISGIGTNFGAIARPLLGQQFVEHLASIHRLDWRNAGLTAFDVPEPGMQAVEWQLNWWERVWEEDVNEDVPVMRLAMAWMRANAPPVDTVTIVHGDYRTGNFLYTEDDNRISAILDWELGHLGDRHEDLAWAIRSTFGHVAEDGRTFLVGGFMPEREFLRLYSERFGLAADAHKLEFYKLFNAYKNTLIVLGTGRRVASGGKSHQDVLLGWLSGIGYTMLDDLWSILSNLLQNDPPSNHPQRRQL